MKNPAQIHKSTTIFIDKYLNNLKDKQFDNGCKLSGGLTHLLHRASTELQGGHTQLQEARMELPAENKMPILRTHGSNLGNLFKHSVRIEIYLEGHGWLS